MARLELAQRLLCSQGRIDAGKFRSGFVSAEDRKKLIEASAHLSKAPLFIDDTPARTVTEIAACARRLKRKQNLGFLVIDYLQLIQPDDPRDPRQEQVAKMARRLKCLARELNIPLLCLAQLNRQVESGKESHRPRLSHLRESGAIEQDADVVMFIHREEMYHSREEAQEMNVQGQADIIVAKQRNGPTDDIKLAWFDKYTRFENLLAEAVRGIRACGRGFLNGAGGHASYRSHTSHRSHGTYRTHGAYGSSSPPGGKAPLNSPCLGRPIQVFTRIFRVSSVRPTLPSHGTFARWLHRPSVRVMSPWCGLLRRWY